MLARFNGSTFHRFNVFQDLAERLLRVIGLEHQHHRAQRGRAAQMDRNLINHDLRGLPHRELAHPCPQRRKCDRCHLHVVRPAQAAPRRPADQIRTGHQVLPHRRRVNHIPAAQPPSPVTTASPGSIGPFPTASRSISAPPTRLMAPATPPPIHRWLLAALTMASTANVVMSLRSTLMIVRPMVRSIATSGNDESRKRGNAHPSQQPSTHSPTERPWFRASAFPRFRVSVSPSVLLAPP